MYSYKYNPIIFITSNHVKAFEEPTGLALTYLIERYNFSIIYWQTFSIKHEPDIL